MLPVPGCGVKGLHVVAAGLALGQQIGVEVQVGDVVALAALV